MHGGSVETVLPIDPQPLNQLLKREWLVTNGLGGYASSTVPGLNTRKYHGLLVAAMSPPVRRMVMVSRIEETLWQGGTPAPLDCNEYPGVIFPEGHLRLREFSLDPSPCWIYQVGSLRLKKQLRLLRGQNTVVLSYTLLEGGMPADLQIRPLLALRPMHQLGFQWNGPLAAEERGKRHYRIPPTRQTPEFFFAHTGRFSPALDWYLNQIYRREAERGYPGLEDLFTPGFIRFRLSVGHTAHWVGSTEPIDLLAAVELADKQFSPSSVAVPAGDPALRALERCAEQLTAAAGEQSGAEPAPWFPTSFPWSAPSGRDMLIGFAGLFLVPGKFNQAKSQLLAFASLMRDGLMPSHFGEDGSEPVYHGADVSLWFVQAVWDYLRYTADDASVFGLMDAVAQIVDAYQHDQLKASPVRLSMDGDGLLASRAPGLATSWMDAKIDNWVITPRTGRPVELNALWHNAVRICGELSARYGHADRAAACLSLAARIHHAFNARFWNESASCCFDVVEDHGSDSSIRPNQLLAISLPFPVLQGDRFEKVLAKVEHELLTPLGLRTLSPADSGYVGHYGGGIVARDRAHHNGCVFPWLLGPYLSALAKTASSEQTIQATTRRLLAPCVQHLTGIGMGQLPELFDGTPPHAPGGAVASAPSVGEVLRAFSEFALGHNPAVSPVNRGCIEPGGAAGSLSPPCKAAAGKVFPFFS
jgi:predicted glycogen debranching enzyme